MVAKVAAGQFVCTKCGHQTGKWMGFCSQCRSNGTLERLVAAGRAASVTPISAVPLAEAERVSTGLGEIDRALGGGLVAGSAIVVGGEPGAGKSTLVLQIAGSMVARGLRVLVVSGEESPAQIAMRASRIDGSYDGVELATSHDVDEVIGLADSAATRATLSVVDSIQTRYRRSMLPGTLDGGVAQASSQLREASALDSRSAAKRLRRCRVVLIGHVTKDGSIGGAATGLEHMVDVVLYLEGDVHLGSCAICEDCQEPFWICGPRVSDLSRWTSME